MLNLKQIALKKWANYTLHNWQMDCKNPKRKYEQNLTFLQKNTCQQKILNLKSIDDIRLLPLTDYKDYKEIFSNSLNTKINSLNGDKIHFLSTSTGTTSSPKYFPISPMVDKALEPFKKIRASLLLKELNIWNNAPELIFVLPGETKSKNKSLPIGQIGYYFQKQTPKWLEKQFIFTKDLYHSKKEFDQWHIVASLLSDCSGITTSIPARLIYFLNHIYTNRLEIRDTLLKNKYPNKIIKKTSDDRLKYIIKTLEQPIQSVNDLWPSLKFICVWHSGSGCSKQLNELKESFNFKNVQFIDQVYNSSEDVFNIPLINEIGGPLNIYNHIIEFYDSKNKQFYWPWEIQINKVYEIIVTNVMGLTRYRMFDNVICTGFYHHTPKIAFHSRNLPEISLGWCTVSEEQLMQSIYKCSIINSNCYFILNLKGNGLIMVTFNESFVKYVNEIDGFLRELNTNYNQQIDLGNVSPLNYKIVSEKEFHQTMLNHPNKKSLLVR